MSLFARALGIFGHKATVAAPAALELRVVRLERDGDALHGKMDADGVFLCVTLERASKAIPAGRYPVRMTVSGRAQEGSLWTPREDCTLPEVCDVPGRTGIRLHAANEARQLEGCIAPGAFREGDGIGQSRAALIAVIAKLEAAPAAYLTVEDA